MSNVLLAWKLIFYQGESDCDPNSFNCLMCFLKAKMLLNIEKFWMQSCCLSICISQHSIEALLHVSDPKLRWFSPLEKHIVAVLVLKTFLFLVSSLIALTYGTKTTQQ